LLEVRIHGHERHRNQPSSTLRRKLFLLSAIVNQQSVLDNQKLRDASKVTQLNFQSLFGLYASSPLTDACRPVLGSDALMNGRTLFEPGELGRPPQAHVRPILMRPDGASLVLGPFAETKGPRLPGRNPALPNITLVPKLEPSVRYSLQ
ncbi:MAG TPA: hypothetical protein PKK23_19035, partial [Nitrospirales bacterium]|nr:hypothetical protein [Nitrospirales bacterium]